MQEPNKTDQLKLGVKSAKNEGLYNLINRLNETERKFAVMPFWRNGTSVFAFMSVLFTILVSLTTSIIWAPRLSKEIPLFYSVSTTNWEIYHQISLFFYSVVVWGLQFGVLYLSYKVYPDDRRLSFISNIFLIVISILFLITIGQIFSLQLL